MYARPLLAAVLAFSCSRPLEPVRVHYEFRHVVLTWSQDATSTSMTANLFSSGDLDDARVSFGREPGVYQRSVAAVAHRIPGIENATLLRAELTVLEPGTAYYFRFEQDDEPLTEERSLRTLPGDGSPLRILVGGDQGTAPSFQHLARLAATYQPDLAVLGGDLAYGNGMTKYWPRWEQWFRFWDRLLSTRDGHEVPVIAAIGNHETNTLSRGNPSRRAPYYLSLLAPDAKTTFYRRQLAPYATLVVLDTGHVARHAAQVPWLEKNLVHPDEPHHLLACYHVPLYPSARPFYERDSRIGRELWGPLFDERGLDLAFEHHDHAVKRTKPMRAGAVAENGTVFIGDGAWSGQPRQPDPSRIYLDNARYGYHFWIVDISPDSIRGRAVGAEGEVLDQFELAAD
jgi:hypothetical protein